MKKLVLLPLVLAFATNAALAANSVDLRVTGTITPAACNISLAGGDFAYGTIDGGTLNTNTSTTVSEMGGRTLDIICSGATQVAIKAIDNRMGSIPVDQTSGDLFGLGVDGAGNPIGFYQIKVIESLITVDGAAGAIKFSDDNGATWLAGGELTHLQSSAKSSRILAPDFATASANSQPSPITSASIGIKVNPTIQPTSTLDISNDIALDGSATIELVYL